ncbi:MAG: DUF58 domain-containing protein [Pirellulales bacterium]
MTSEQQTSPFFEPQLLAGLERMRFTTRRAVEGAYAGRHIARRIGGAGEFVDYREYSPGDDLRRVDWRVMARTGRTYLKLFQDETDLRCTMVLDVSGSMAQGARSPKDTTGSKLAWAQYLTTALSHLIILERDAVGLATVREKLIDYTEPSSSFQQRPILHQQIATLRPVGSSDLARGLDDLLLRVRRRGVLFLVSDFLVDSMDRLVSSLRKYRELGWELICIHVVHPDEEQLPTGVAFRFQGLEADGELNCQVTELRAAYQQRFARHLAATRAALLGLGCDYYLAHTQLGYLQLLKTFLVLRSA